MRGGVERALQPFVKRHLQQKRGQPDRAEQGLTRNRIRRRLAEDQCGGQRNFGEHQRRGNASGQPGMFPVILWQCAVEQRIVNHLDEPAESGEGGGDGQVRVAKGGAQSTLRSSRIACAARRPDSIAPSSDAFCV